MNTVMKPLPPVFPSEENTIFVKEDDVYGGAHIYTFTNSYGHVDGKPVYAEVPLQKIEFVKKEGDEIIPGLQTEQILIALIDRHEKLNAVFPSKDGEKAIKSLKQALTHLENRVKERTKRGVMGKLEK